MRDVLREILPMATRRPIMTAAFETNQRLPLALTVTASHTENITRDGSGAETPL